MTNTKTSSSVANSGLKLKTALKAGFKACNSDNGCSSSNHNQSVA